MNYLLIIVYNYILIHNINYQRVFIFKHSTLYYRVVIKVINLKRTA